MKTKPLLLIAILFCAVQARVTDKSEYPAWYGPAKSWVASSPGGLLPSDSLNCRLVGHCNVYGGSYAYGNIACVASGDSGLYTVDISDKTNPHVLGRIILGDPGLRTVNSVVMVSQNLAYVCCSSYLYSVDISNPVAPVAIKRCGQNGWLLCLCQSGNYVYASQFTDGLAVFDVSEPDTVKLIGSCALTGHYFQQTAKAGGNYVCVATWDSGMSVVDVSAPAHPSEVGHYHPDAGKCEFLDAVGNYAYVTEGDSLAVIDISDPAHPTRVGYCGWSTYTVSVHVSGNYAYCAASTGGLRVVDISDPNHPTQVGYRTTGPNNAGWVCASDGYAYVTEETGLDIVQFYGVGIKEDGRLSTNRPRLTATIVRGVLRLPAAAGAQPQAPSWLLDAAGRRVMELHPGPNDVGHLSPGVCFVRGPGSVEKVLLTR